MIVDRDSTGLEKTENSSALARTTRSSIGEISSRRTGRRQERSNKRTGRENEHHREAVVEKASNVSDTTVNCDDTGWNPSAGALYRSSFEQLVNRAKSRATGWYVIQRYTYVPGLSFVHQIKKTTPGCSPGIVCTALLTLFRIGEGRWYCQVEKSTWKILRASCWKNERKQ
ncbi:MAG: hypothetical protein QME66_05425 [Candidatus Eisenbacteria bacterium]|nr:hypothetical protein [Candidatus Eisenbacteria bacterium]